MDETIFNVLGLATVCAVTAAWAYAGNRMLDRIELDKYNALFDRDPPRNMSRREINQIIREYDIGVHVENSGIVYPSISI